MNNKEVLEQFRDLKLTKIELYSKLPKDYKRIILQKPIEINSNHLIELLSKYIEGSINEGYILDWVNIVWFSGWFEYCDKQDDSIASVMNELEELDEEGKYLSIEKAKDYIKALKLNIEI